jgi:hypothetical protein
MLTKKAPLEFGKYKLLVYMQELSNKKIMTFRFRIAFKFLHYMYMNMLNSYIFVLNRHTLPQNSGDQIDSHDEFWEKKLREGNPIILYLHGNSSSRYNVILATYKTSDSFCLIWLDIYWTGSQLVI